MSDEKTPLQDDDMSKVGGGEGGASGDWGYDEGGATVSWAKLVCPICHGDVVQKRVVEVSGRHINVRYKCAVCDKLWKKNELVEEP